MDARATTAFESRHITGAISVPLGEVEARLDEFPRDQAIHISCAVGARAYNAVRLLVQHGFDASLLSGGAETWFCVREERPWPTNAPAD